MATSNKKPDGTLETNQNNFLLAGHIGTSGFENLEKNIKSENGIAIKIDNLNNIFLIWEEVADAINPSDEELDGEITTAKDVKIEICDEQTVLTQNNSCSYTLSLEAFAETYTLFQ